MRTLLGWILGVFALGLVVGSLYRSIAAENELDRANPSLESSLRSAPSVDCGPGREAVLAPVAADAGTAVQIKCVSTSPEGGRARAATVTPRAAAAVAPTAPAPVPAPVPAPSPALGPAAATTAPSSTETAQVDSKTSRSTKDSALIIGGAAGAGAGIGAVAKGKKGAAVGAAVGGVAGTVYDLLTRNKNKN